MGRFNLVFQLQLALLVVVSAEEQIIHHQSTFDRCQIRTNLLDTSRGTHKGGGSSRFEPVSGQCSKFLIVMMKWWLRTPPNCSRRVISLRSTSFVREVMWRWPWSTASSALRQSTSTCLRRSKRSSCTTPRFFFWRRSYPSGGCSKAVVDWGGAKQCGAIRYVGERHRNP